MMLFLYQSPCPIGRYFDFQYSAFPTPEYAEFGKHSSLATSICCLPFVASMQRSPELQAHGTLVRGISFQPHHK